MQLTRDIADRAKVMKLIDHTVLEPFERPLGSALSDEDRLMVNRLVHQAGAMGTYSVCVNPVNADEAREQIGQAGYDLKLAVVVDFPFGTGTTAQRVASIAALRNVADEIDIVLRIGLVKAGRLDRIATDLRVVSEQVHERGMVLKAIVETAYLSASEKPGVFEIVLTSGADFIKTSTGFAAPDYTERMGNTTIGADPRDIQLMSALAVDLGRTQVGIKASGKIRTYAQVAELWEASGRAVDPTQFRIGSSKTKEIYEEMLRT